MSVFEHFYCPKKRAHILLETCARFESNVRTFQTERVRIDFQHIIDLFEQVVIIDLFEQVVR